MRRNLLLFVSFAALLISSCTARVDNTPVTMLVTQGFGEWYCKELAEDVKNELGIDIEFVYENATDQSALVMLDFVNNDMKADLVFTYAKIPNEYLENCCLDFVSHSDFTTRYPYPKLTEFMTKDGCVYQMPLSTKLVGISYNATLMEEKGWEVPRTFQDMLDLKKKCDEENILFAVTDIKYSGNGFNYLFNIMGSQWLSTVKGTVWFDGFLDGTKTMNVFQEKAGYFKKWTEADLFGELMDNTKSASLEFGRRRALFCYSSRNQSSGYKGYQYDAGGNRTGAYLRDVHKSMPWVSEDGSNNCFTVYDNCWVMANRSLLDKNRKPQLEKVLKVLDFMMSEKYAAKIEEVEKDVYITFAGYEVHHDRLFFDYADEIMSGYLQPWYYNEFSESTIVRTGSELGSYLINNYLHGLNKDRFARHINYSYNSNATFDSAIGMLRNTLHSQDEDYLGWVEELLDASKVAQLTAIAGGMSLQEQLEKQEITVALMPYANDLRALQPWRAVSVQNAKAFPGAFQLAYANTLVPPGCYDIQGIWMTGEQILEIITEGYDPSGYFIDSKTGESSFDSGHYGPYPYACMIKNNEKIDPGKVYIVAVPPKALRKDVYDDFKQNGKVLLSRIDHKVLVASLTHGISLYFDEHPSVNRTNITW